MTTKTTPAARPATITGFARPLSIRTAQSVAACASLGLSYWADASTDGCVWAVDAEQHPHLVRVDRRNGHATHGCTQTSRFDPTTQGPRGYVKTCQTMRRTADWAINDHVQALFDTSVSIVDETVTEVAQHVTSVAYQPKGAHGYPYRAHCSCGWASVGYAADHAAQGRADDHAADLAISLAVSVDEAIAAAADRDAEQHASVAAIDTAIEAGMAQLHDAKVAAFDRAINEAAEPLRAMTISVGGKSVVTDRQRKQMLGRRVHAAVAAMLDGLTAEDFAEMGFTVEQSYDAYDFAKTTASKWVSYVPTDQK